MGSVTLSTCGSARFPGNVTVPYLSPKLHNESDFEKHSGIESVERWRCTCRDEDHITFEQKGVLSIKCKTADRSREEETETTSSKSDSGRKRKFLISCIMYTSEGTSYVGRAIIFISKEDIARASRTENFKDENVQTREAKS